MNQIKIPSDTGNQDPLIEKLLLHLHNSSRTLAELTANMVYENPGLLHSLISIAWMKEPHAQRASRIVSFCALQFPELIKPYSATIIKKLESVQSKSVIRNFLKIFAEAPVRLTNKDKSILVNCCFGFLLSGEYPVAIKMYSMQLLYNLSLEMPEIGGELALVLIDKLPGSSPGYKSRARKILTKLGHLNKEDLL